MTTNNIKIERLQEFANYLSTKELKSKDLFPTITQIKIGENDEIIIPFNTILFIALFELPHIFPDDWAYNNQFEPIWKKRCQSESFSSVRTWFGINELQFEHLFFPGHQVCEMFGGRKINEVSTQHDLAFNVESLIKSVSANRLADNFRFSLN